MEDIVPLVLTKFHVYSIMIPLWFYYGSIMEVVMVAITVKNIPATLYERVKERAKANHRSINNELITILEQSVMLQPINVAETLEQTRRIRELTAHYVITDDELTHMKNEGRE
jgi:plasmid stability protein